MGGLMSVVLISDGRGEVVRLSTAPEENALVGGALKVIDYVRVRRDALSPLPADLLPEVLPQRFRQDDQRVDRRDLTVQRSKATEVRLAGEDDDPRPYLPARSSKERR